MSKKPGPFARSRKPALARVKTATPVDLGDAEQYLDPVDREKTRRRVRVGMIARARKTTRAAADRWLRRLSDRPRDPVPDGRAGDSIHAVEDWADRGRP
jgi:hypothetical protein